MNTLRAKLVVLLAIVIVFVVSILTGVLLYLLRPPGSQHMEPVAEQVMMLASIAKHLPGAVALSPAPAGGAAEKELTEWLRDTLTAKGSDIKVFVSREGEGGRRAASIATEGGWIIWPMPTLPPRDGGWRALGSWLLLITLGALAISAFIANRMIQPLVLLDKAIGQVGPDAILPELPVKGPAEVRVAARALNSLSSRLKSAMESRMRLVAAAGHDLRTPITRMRLRAEFVGDDEDRAMWLKDIDELERIADSAILLVREEQGKHLTETFRLDELVHEVTQELRALAYVADLPKVTPSLVRGNRHALGRAFRNLIINAATHGKGARIRMESWPGRVRVTIEDRGPGIPSNLLGQAFEPFFRADPARRQDIPGAGLGLTIAKEIVIRAGGEIHIRNGAEGGLVQFVEMATEVE